MKGRDLVIFAGDWGWFPSVMERIAEHLLPDNRILWIGSLSMRRPRLRAYDVKRVAGRLLSIFSERPGPKAGEMRPHELHPFILPFYDVPGIRQLNDTLLRRAIVRRTAELGFRDIIVLTATPMVAGLLGRLGERSSHYFCLDDYSEYVGAYRCIPDLERRLLEKINACFALSSPLMESRKARSGENHFLPMGVDTELFGPGSEASAPPELRNLKKPIIGFFGQIGSYVDIDLIVRCAESYPDASFVVIGRPHTDISPFGRAKNITFMGEVRYRDVPSYARAFDVAINPRVVNKLSLAMNPLKILEYLSLGLPVVSTDLPAVRTFAEVVHIATSKDHFVDLIGRALQDGTPEQRHARRRVAEQYSWKSITEGITSVIERIESAP